MLVNYVSVAAVKWKRSTVSNEDFTDQYSTITFNNFLILCPGSTRQSCVCFGGGYCKWNVWFDALKTCAQRPSIFFYKSGKKQITRMHWRNFPHLRVSHKKYTSINIRGILLIRGTSNFSFIPAWNSRKHGILACRRGGWPCNNIMDILCGGQPKIGDFLLTTT